MAEADKGETLPDINRQDNFFIRLRQNGHTVVLSANKQGLVSLGELLLSPAKEPDGTHIHPDPYHSPEEDSSEWMIEKTSSIKVIFHQEHTAKRNHSY